MHELRRMLPLAVGGLLFAAAACSSPAPLQTIDAPTVEALDGNRLRDLAFAYWEAFNAYDEKRTLAFLDVGYRSTVEAEIRRDIGRIRSFNVKLGVSEETPPQLLGPGHAQMYLIMREPLGTRRIQMSFIEIDEDWKITYAEEVE